MKNLGSILNSYTIKQLFPQTELYSDLCLVICSYYKVTTKTEEFLETEVSVVELENMADYILNKNITLEIIDDISMLSIIQEIKIKQEKIN